MSGWSTYGPEDFLLFSERVYWRLLELHNAALWPAQIVALLLGAACVFFVLRPRSWSSRLIASILAGAWAFVAWAFFWDRYATVNWAAHYVVPFFLIEAMLLVWIGGLRGRLAVAARGEVGDTLGMALIVYALAVHPLVAVIAGRPLASAEVFGVAPDPTAMATLGVVAMARAGAIAWLVLLVPAVWCAVSSATLLAMGAWEGWIPLTAISLAVVARLWPRANGPT